MDEKWVFQGERNESRGKMDCVSVTRGVWEMVGRRGVEICLLWKDKHMENLTMVKQIRTFITFSETFTYHYRI